MRERSCEVCAAVGAEKDGFLLGSRFLCQGCVERLGEEARRQQRTITVNPAQDPTLCARCGHDGGAVEHGRVAGVPLCGACAARTTAWPFPTWLKLGAAGLGALLLVALVRGMPALAPGLAFLRAERHVAAGRFAQASDALAKVLETNPDCAQAVLLKIKADILSDRFAAIGPLVERVRQHRFEGKLIVEVNDLLERTRVALGALAEAAKLAEHSPASDAQAHLDKAHASLPGSKAIGISWHCGRAATRFEAKDYQGFLAESEQAEALQPDDPVMVAQVASALAACFAASGDDGLKARAQDQLARARASCRDDASRQRFAEYSERIEHRLRTREIIDKSEYDRRFRSTTGDKK